MNNLTKLLLPMVAIATMAACTKEIGESPLPGQESGELKEYVLNLQMPEPATKTVLGAKDGDSYPVYWCEGDVVSLNGAVTGAVTERDDHSSSTRLSVKTNATAPFNVLYPGVAGVTDLVTFPTEQTYEDGTFNANAMPMYGTTNDLSGSIQMNYLASVIRIPLKFTTTTKVRRILITSPSGTALSGDFRIGKSEGALNGVLSPVEVSSSVTYSFGQSGRQFAAGSEPVFHIAVPKGIHDEELNFRVYDIDGNYMEAIVSFAGGTEITAGKVYEFPSRAFVHTGKVFLIETPDDLVYFASTRSIITEALVVNDINMTGREYPGDKFNYYGFLDGEGHTIKGLTKPLFNNLYGSARDLVLNSTITEAVCSGANDYGLGVLCRYAYLTDEEHGQSIESITTKGSITVNHSPGVDFSIGGMIGCTKGLPMRNCHNEASVVINSLTPSASTVVRIGGLVGSVITESSNISGCSNSGSVSVNGMVLPTENSILDIGGLIGYDTVGNTVDYCTNRGKVSVNALSAASGAPYLMVGGVVGNSTSDNFRMENCTNEAGADVTVGTEVSAQNVRIGGVIGRVGGANTVISACNNAATVEMKASEGISSSNTFGGIAGVVLAENCSFEECVNSGSVKNAARKMESMSGVVAFVNYPSVFIACENSGTVTSTAVPGNPQYVAGVVGKKTASAGAAVNFTACKNSGDVSVTCTEHSNPIFMAGIIAGCPGGGSVITGCENSGNITNNSVKTSYYATKSGEIDPNGTPGVAIGGIVGRVTDNALGLVSSCINKGDIVNNCAAVGIRLGGIIGYSHQTIEGITACTNEGRIENTQIADYCYANIGGIIGYASAKCPLSGADTNKGAVINSSASLVSVVGTTDTNVRLGGVIGTYNSSSNTQCTGAVNEGEILNSSDEIVGWCYQGGIIGVNYGSFTINGASNSGSVRNDGVTSDLRMGGICGTSTTYISISGESQNSGDITAGGTLASVFAAGVIGYQKDNTNSIIKASNTGAVSTTTATSGSLEIAGVVADAAGLVSDCTNSGPITIGGNVGEKLYCGGVVAYNCDKKAMSNLVNQSSGTITAGDITVAGQMWVGGVCGGEPNSIEITHSNLVNAAAITLGSSGIDSSNTSYSYLGGVSGGNGSTKVTYDDCHDTGNLYYKGKHRMRVGGIASYASVCPTGGCTVNANISYFSTKGGSSYSDVGGVVGYLNVAAISDLKYEGYLNTYGSSPRAYTGGIVGNQNSTACTFSNCKVGGQVRGITDMSYVGLICCTQTNHEVNFTDCIVKTGTKRGTATVTSLVLNHGDGNGALCGGLKSTGTMSNCTIGSIE